MGTVLVTGGKGFLESHLVSKLSDLGETVRVFARRNSMGEDEEASKCHVIWGDIRDPLAVEEAVKGVDIVIHLVSNFRKAGTDKKDAFSINVIGTQNIMDAALKFDVEQEIHCSTVGVHGDVKELPATENTPFNPMDYYHKTKLAGELAILDYARTLPENGMIVTVNRPAMVYGPGDPRMLKLFKTILSGKFRMIGSGDTLAHLGYIEDQTESFLLCAVALREKVHLEAFNIASDAPITLNELTSLIAEYGGAKILRMHIPVAPVWFAALLCEMICKPFRIKPPLFRRRVGFFTHNRAFDISKARNHLGYNPRWSHKKGIEKTIQWYREQNLV